jgi:hypothetical protein
LQPLLCILLRIPSQHSWIEYDVFLVIFLALPGAWLAYGIMAFHVALLVEAWSLEGDVLATKVVLTVIETLNC